MGIFSNLFGSKDKHKRLSTKTKQQEEALKNYLSQGIETTPLYGAGSDYLMSLLGGGENAFSQFEAPYLQQFQQEIAPGIAERFTGMGTGAGAQSSSALNNSLAQAGGNLQNQLASLHGNLRNQALGQALQYAQQPYSNQLAGIGMNTFENTYQPGSTGFLGGALAGLGGGFGQGFGQFGGNMFGQRMFGGGGTPSVGQPGAL